MALPSSPRAVITGAGAGLGRALALELARLNGSLVLADIDAASGEETVRQALGLGAKEARFVRCDVRKLADVESLAAASTGQLDLVVNNAGVSSSGTIGELPIADWQWTLDVNLWGAIHGCHVFVPRLRQQGHGTVLNVSAAAGLLSAPRTPAYNVSKAGVVALSETLADELAGTRIGVTVLCPTFFRTGIIASGRFADEQTKKTAQRLIEAGDSPEAIARAALNAVRRGQLYCVPTAGALWPWRVKRWAPSLFRRLIVRWADSVSST